VLSCVVDHILQEFNTLFLTTFRNYKIAAPPQTKTPVKTTFRDWCLYSSFVHGLPLLSLLKRELKNPWWERSGALLVLLVPLNEIGEEVHGEREDDRGVLLRADRVQGLQVAQLNKDDIPRHLF
jgi:hypothetical protein